MLAPPYGSWARQPVPRMKGRVGAVLQTHFYSKLHLETRGFSLPSPLVFLRMTSFVLEGEG